MYDVYMRKNNTHIRAYWPTFSPYRIRNFSSQVKFNVGLLLLRCLTELAWPIIDLTF